MPQRGIRASDLAKGDSPVVSMEDAVAPVASPRELMAALRATGASFGEALGMVVATVGESAARAIFEAKISRIRNPALIMDLFKGIAQGAPTVADAWLFRALATRQIQAWKVGRYEHGLHLRGCDWVTRLPDGLQVDGSLYLEGCVGLVELPRGLSVFHSIMASGCVNLERIQDAMPIGGFLDLRGCSSLRSLPDGLSVGGHLELKGCASLAQLPQRLRTGGYLGLEGCTAWDGMIPDGTYVKGMVLTDRHPRGGPSLAEWRKRNPRGEHG